MAAYALYLLLLISVVPWRSESIYSGGVDSVVLAKAFIAVMTLCGALALATRPHTHQRLGLGPGFLILLVLLVSILGSLIAGNLEATFVLAVRILIVVATVLVLLTVITASEAIVCLLSAMGTLAMIAAATGAPGLLVSGRVGGGIPEVHPNELAALAGTPLVGLSILILRNGIRARYAASALLLLVIVIATGSRTALIAIASALFVALVFNGVRRRDNIFLVLVAAPMIYAVAFFTDTFGNLATRAGSTDTTAALDARFDAWEVVLAWDWSLWQKWIGLGLSVKEIPVDIKWRDVQVLDSSWVSLLAQTGVVGTALVAALILWCAGVALMSRERRWFVLPLLTLLIFRSATESGLVDSASPFVLLVTLASILTPRSLRQSPREPGLMLSPIATRLS